MLRQFWKSESGNYALILAIAVVPIMAAIAGAVDFVSTENKATQLQNSLDAAGIAIAAHYISGMSEDDLRSVGHDFFSTNMAGIVVDASAFKFDNETPAEFAASASSSGGEDFITVRSGITHQGMIGSLNWKANRVSVVRIKKGPPACVLALDPHASASVKFQGSTKVELNGCVVASNSDSSSSVSRGGSASLTTECVNTVGGTYGIGGTSNAKLACGAPQENQYPSFDPLANVVPPNYTGCEPVPNGNNKKTLSPGTYCDKISGEVTLLPGVYVLKGGKIDLGGNGSLVGAGVTIFLMKDAEFSVNGNETVQLSPPTSGPYAGIAIYQERTNANTLKINGASGSKVSGFVYAPGAHVFYAGNSATTGLGGCMRLVGKTIEMTGNSAIRSDCTAELGGRSMFAGRFLSLIR
jgi:Flp pilus assembly protein TadG